MTVRTYVASNHAIEKYRERVIFCCERSRPDSVVLPAIYGQIDDMPWRLAGGETFAVECGPMRPSCKMPGHMVVDHVTHTFVVEAGVVVTVLGFMMRTNRRKNRRKATKHRRRRLRFFADPRFATINADPS